MLKPPVPVEGARVMRHLSVPSKETASWKARLEREKWLAKGHGIHHLDGRRGIPLSTTAPGEIDGLPILDLPPLSPSPKHWTERLPQEIRDANQSDWPMSHDQIGDVVILKIPEAVESHSDIIGQCILNQIPSARIVCADNGVKGEFRVRDLDPIASRDGTTTTQTRVKEHGALLWVDPGSAYYSPRLATERQGTLACARGLNTRLKRPLVICDPYAGVGPALLPLLAEEGLVDRIVASDLNPKAASLLRQNLPDSAWVGCRDARKLHDEMAGFADIVLVNLPHDSIDHLPDMIPLLAKGHEVVIRGWAILPLEEMDAAEKKVRAILGSNNLLSLELVPARSYSPRDTYTCIEAHLLLSE